jgi:hypothetical protein
MRVSTGRARNAAKLRRLFERRRGKEHPQKEGARRERKGERDDGSAVPHFSHNFSNIDRIVGTVSIPPTHTTYAHTVTM